MDPKCREAKRQPTEFNRLMKATTKNKNAADPGRFNIQFTWYGTKETRKQENLLSRMKKITHRRNSHRKERRRTDKDTGEHTGLNTQGGQDDYTQVKLIRAGQTITKRRENKQMQEVILDMT